MNTNQKIKELIEKYKSKIKMKHSFEHCYIYSKCIKDLEALLEPECKHDSGANLTVDEVIDMNKKYNTYKQ